MASFRDVISDSRFGELTPADQSIVIRRAGATDPRFQGLSPEDKQIVEQKILRAKSPGLLSRLGGAALTGLRAVDVPRQAVLAHAAGLPLRQSIEQVTDPTKSITGAQVIEGQLPGTALAEPRTLPALAGRIGLEALLEFADPLLLAGGVKKAVQFGQKALGGEGKIASSR